VPERTRDAILDNEFSVLRHGIYNLGFVAVSNTAEGRRFAEWWADRLKDFCYDDIPRGLFTDQRWVDLAPAYFDSVRILRSPQYNVCTWNLTHRTVNGSFARGFTVNGLPLVFYHFSGLDSGAAVAARSARQKGEPSSLISTTAVTPSRMIERPSREGGSAACTTAFVPISDTTSWIASTQLTGSRSSERRRRAALRRSETPWSEASR
jgi:hypothetical protein